MLTCKDASHLISHRQERPLTFRERAGLRFHLWICANCRRFERQVAWLHTALRELGRCAEAEPGDLSPEAKERIRLALRKEQDR